jgi:hypothetical protein
MSNKELINEYRKMADENPEYAWIYEDDIRELELELQPCEVKKENCEDKLKAAWLGAMGLIERSAKPARLVR